jgi:SAM-dependent methyltransferase
MIAHATANPPDSATSGWRILDFGCGTGFASEQVLTNIPADAIACLTGYDPSPEMADRARKKLTGRIAHSLFTSSWDEMESMAPYNLLVTNSVMHHLPDGFGGVNQLVNLLAPDAFWIASHEPSRRYYANAQCQQQLAEFLAERRWRRFLSPAGYWRRIKHITGIQRNPWQETARIAHSRGLFLRQPPVAVIDRLIDVHVPEPGTHTLGIQGFDTAEISAALAPHWQLEWQTSYNFIGSFYVGNLPLKWARVYRDLEARYPDDGANFSTIWRRME